MALMVIEYRKTRDTAPCLIKIKGQYLFFPWHSSLWMKHSSFTVCRKKTKKVGVVLLYYNDLREEVRRLKWEDKYSYKEIAEYLEIKPRSLYNWLAG